MSLLSVMTATLFLFLETLGNAGCLPFTQTTWAQLFETGFVRSWKTWKVIEFKNFIFQAWKVMEFNCQSWKVM